jgi:PIN domain nuclease of toxin-antitoxin system
MMTRWLLDTHAWLWWTRGDARFGPDARHRLQAAPQQVLLSAASSHEIAIKYAIGRLKLRDVPHRYVPAQLALQGIEAVPIEHAHVLHVATLPMLHRDPFDRLLVAQAQLLGATIVTADPDIARYDVEVLDPR